MFISSQKWNISQLVLQINTQGFYSVTHGVRCCNSRQIKQELRNGSLFSWFFKVFLFVWALVLWFMIALINRLMTHFYFFFQVVIVFLGSFGLVINGLLGRRNRWLGHWLAALGVLTRFEIVFESLILIYFFDHGDFLFGFRNIKVTCSLL